MPLHFHYRSANNLAATKQWWFEPLECLFRQLSKLPLMKNFAALKLAVAKMRARWPRSMISSLTPRSVVWSN